MLWRAAHRVWHPIGRMAYHRWAAGVTENR